MLTDAQGNPVTGATPAAVAEMDAAQVALNLFRGDPVGLAERAVSEAPAYVMAHLYLAWLHALATDPAASLAARTIADRARRLPMNDREASHLAALDQVLAGNWTRAALLLDRHGMVYPHDLLALTAGHQIDFFRANARDLRDRIARVLPRWSPDMPGHSVLLGMYAFGLEECGDYGRAEAMGREAVARQPLDAWAHHAVAHVLEMQGRAGDGIAWTRTRQPFWTGDDSFFQTHNWWHLALCHLELEEGAAALAIYDDFIGNQETVVPGILVDAASLLWRIHLTGQDVGPRWDWVAREWEGRADGRLYPFNDLHAAMAWLGAGRPDLVADLLTACRTADGQSCEAGQWARQTGLPLVEGVVAFWHGDFATAVERLHGARFIVNSFGGSHAQRDVIDWTLTEAAIRGGMRNTAEALASERLQLRPHSPLNRRFLHRAASSGEALH